MPRIVVPIPRTEQPQQHVKIAQGWAGRIPNAMIQSLDMSVDESPIVTIGTVGRLVNAGGVMTTHSSAAVNFQRTKFRNPYASGNGVGMWLLIQFSTTTTGQSDKIICSLGSDSGGAGNTIFAGNLTTTNTFRSLHGGSSLNLSAWQDSGVVITDGKPHTALMYTATSPSGATVFYKGFLDGKKYVDSSEAKVIGNLAYTYLCAGGIRRTSDIAGFTGNVGLVACILDDMPDALAESLTRNPWQIFEDEEFPVWFSAAGGAATLEGAAAATSTATGTLATQIPIIGAASTVATATGALSTSIPLLGAAVVTATASGDLSAQIKFNGSAIAQALAAGGITTGIPLVGAASGVAGASGSLDASASLAAAAQAIATAVGSLTTQITLSGAAISQAFASGELTAPGSGLSGAAVGQVTAAGSLTTSIPLVGAAQAYAAGTGGLTTIIPLAGAAASVSAATGNLTVQITLTGAAIAQALAGGVLTTQVVLSGAAVSLASAAGVLTGGSAIVDSTWLVRPKARRYSTRPAQRIYKGSR